MEAAAEKAAMERGKRLSKRGLWTRTRCLVVSLFWDQKHDSQKLGKSMEKRMDFRVVCFCLHFGIKQLKQY